MRRVLSWLGWPQPRRVLASVCVAAIALCYTWFYLLPLLAPHAPRADDFQDYLFAAHQIAAGADPYANFIRNHVPWDWSLSSGYLYPPLFAALLVPLTWIPNDLAVRVWLLLMQATVLGSLWMIYVTIGRPRRGELVAIGAVLLTFFPLANSQATGAMNGLLLLLLTAAWACWLRRRDVASGAMVGLAAAIKLFPLALLPYLAWRRHWRLLATAGITLVAGIGIGFLITSPAHNLYYFRDMLPHLGAGTGYRENQSLAGFTARLCDRSTADHGGSAGWCGRLLDWPLVVALIGLLLTVTSRATRSGVEFALAVAALPLISSVTWSFHLVLLILPIALLIRQLFDGELSRHVGRILVVAWLCFSVGPAIHYLLIFHPLPHLQGVIAGIPAVVSWIFGETYVIGTLLVVGLLWASVRRATPAASRPAVSRAA